MLTVEHLRVVYPGGVVALDDVSFAVEPGSFTAVLGPSGAGKTTLFRSVVRLVRPQVGRVWFEKEDLLSCPPRVLRRLRPRIALVAQQYHLVRRRSALANCLAGRLAELPLWRCALGWYPESLLAEGLAALDRVGLLDFAFRRADRLSGGQQQRVAVARALVQQARLLLADEPVASLDPGSARGVLGLLRDLCRSGELTVVCNLHQADLAREYSDRVLGLRGGRVVLDRAAADLGGADFASLYDTTGPR